MSALLIISQLLGLVAFGALIWLIVRAGRQHVLWAVAVLLFSPISAIVFAVMHWKAAKQPFVLYMSSLVVAIGLAVHVFMSWGGGEVLRTSGIVNSGIHNQNLTEDDALAFMRANIDFLENANPSPKDRENLEMMRKFLAMAETGMSEEDQRQFSREFLDKVDPATLDEEGRRHLERLREELSGPASASGESYASNEDGAAAPPPARRPAPVVRWEFVEIDPREAAPYVGSKVKLTRANGSERSGTLVGAAAGRLQVERRMYGGRVEFEVELDDVRSLEVYKRVTEAS